jgi:hypothetical protein
MNTTNLVIGTGLSIGPIVSGVLIQSGGGSFEGMLVFAIASVLASCALVLMAQCRQRVSTAQPGAADRPLPPLGNAGGQLRCLQGLGKPVDGELVVGRVACGPLLIGGTHGPNHGRC